MPKSSTEKATCRKCLKRRRLGLEHVLVFVAVLFQRKANENEPSYSFSSSSSITNKKKKEERAQSQAIGHPSGFGPDAQGLQDPVRGR